MKISIIIPTYNEKDTIVTLIKKIRGTLPSAELIVVDDDSLDGTARLVSSIRDKNIKLVVRKGERGLATALWRGVMKSKGDAIVLMDSDFSHDPSEIPHMIKELDAADIVSGSRYTKEGRMVGAPVRALLSRMMNLFVSIFLGFFVTDFTNGFFVVRRHVFDSVPIESGYGDYAFSFLYLAYKKGFRIKEVPSIYVFRTKGETKTSSSGLGLLKYGFSYAKRVLKLRFLP